MIHQITQFNQNLLNLYNLINPLVKNQNKNYINIKLNDNLGTCYNLANTLNNIGNFLNSLKITNYEVIGYEQGSNWIILNLFSGLPILFSVISHALIIFEKYNQFKLLQYNTTITYKELYNKYKNNKFCMNNNRDNFTKDEKQKILYEAFLIQKQYIIQDCQNELATIDPSLELEDLSTSIDIYINLLEEKQLLAIETSLDNPPNYINPKNLSVSTEKIKLLIHEQKQVEYNKDYNI